jgi:hypothetical protein
MDITSLSPEVLRELAKLAEQKVALTKQIAVIDGKINALAKGISVTKSKAASSATEPNSPAASRKSPTAKAKTGRRGQLKQQITALLSNAGQEGMGVKEISKTLGVKNQNVHVWFSTTGRKVEGITKLEGARYALIPVAAAAAPEPAPEQPKPEGFTF